MIAHSHFRALSASYRGLLTLLGALAGSACSSGDSTGTSPDAGTGSESGSSSGGSSGGMDSSTGSVDSSTGGSDASGTSDSGEVDDVVGSGSEGGSDGAVGEGGGGDGGPCPGNALSLTANGYLTGTSGPNNDAAAARVDVDFGTNCTDLPVGNSFRTVEFWAYVFTNSWVGNANTLFFYGHTFPPVARGFGLDFGTNAVNGNHATLDPFTNGGFDDDNQPSGLTTSMNQWVHFAMTWDGTAVRTFVNGVEKITTMGQGVSMLSTDCASAMPGEGQVAIGGYEQDGNYFNGYIDEWRMWNVARTAQDITATMHTTLKGNEMGLVNYLKFDEASGSTAQDSVTTAGHMAHNGTLKSANGTPPTFIPSTAPVSCP